MQLAKLNLSHMTSCIHGETPGSSDVSMLLALHLAQETFSFDVGGDRGG